MIQDCAIQLESKFMLVYGQIRKILSLGISLEIYLWNPVVLMRVSISSDLLA